MISCFILFSIMTIARLVVVIILCILWLFDCKNVDSSASSRNSLDCFNESMRFNISINEQGELDDFVDNVTSAADHADERRRNRCIQVLLTGKSYALDIVKLMGIKLGSGSGLVIVGASKPQVTLDCIANYSDLEELKNKSKPLANISLVVLDGLLFTKCPVPVVLEEVSTVIVQNCVFM